MDYALSVDGRNVSASMSTLCGTVAVVDLVGYSSIAKVLEENISTASVADLNHQIQTFINLALDRLPDGLAYRIIAWTGDGAIVFFNSAQDAHNFSQCVHVFAHEHTGRRSERTAERWFRIGISTGKVNVSAAADQSHEYAGIAIANAKRLEASAIPGEIVVDEDTFVGLATDTKLLYGPKVIVPGKRDEKFRAHRYLVTRQLVSSSNSGQKLTRRRAIQLSAAACVTATVAVCFEWPHIEQIEERILKPLPAKRFVALMAWPVAAPEHAAVIESVLVSIYSRVRQAERHVPNLVVLSTGDISDGIVADSQIESELKPREMAAIWGATLVLAARVEAKGTDFLLHIELLDSQALQVLRSGIFGLKSANLQSVGEVASRSTALWLELPKVSEHATDDDELTSVPALALKLLLEGRAFGKQPNDTGLGQALERYNAAIAEDPEFALAYAELGRAFWRQFENTYDPAFVSRAKESFGRALKLNANSVCALLGQAELLAGEGQAAEALHSIASVLETYPENSEAQFLRGRVFEKNGAFDQAQKSYKMLTEMRPCYWRAHNNLGFVQYQLGENDAALSSFNRAADLAPLVAIPIANRGATYSGMGNRQKAIEDLNRSIELSPNETALSALGDLAFEEKDYPHARDYFARANSLEPRNHITWSDLGDTYKMLGKPDDEKRCLAKAAALLAVHLTINPQDGPAWMMLGLYHARLRETSSAETDIQKAEDLKATDETSFLIKARAFAAMHRTAEATRLVIDHHITSDNVNLSVEFDQVRTSPEYRSYISGISNPQ